MVYKNTFHIQPKNCFHQFHLSVVGNILTVQCGNFIDVKNMHPHRDLNPGPLFNGNISSQSGTGSYNLHHRV